MPSNFIIGSPILTGSQTSPGVPIPPELEVLIPTILQACRDYGLDFYPTVIQMLKYDQMSEIASYGGMPRRYPHWKFGMEYERLQTSYAAGLHRIYEMVIANDPCYMYLMDSNTLLDNLTVIAHATGHNDFFKNNIFFSQTDTNMLNKMANHGARIRRYMDRWGRDKVAEFIDHVLRIETLVDPASAWHKNQFKKEVEYKDKREYHHQRRLNVDRHYMERFINTPEWREQEAERVRQQELEDELEMFKEPTKDILGFLRDCAPLKSWQADIIAMLHDESMYFCPMRATKTINEGFAILVDYEIMCRQGFVGLGQKMYDTGIIEYADHRWRVLGGEFSMNPYKLGFSLLSDIEERWNKGQFGIEWEECRNTHQKENWDTKANLGKEKIFEIRKFYNDAMLINEFFTQDFCDKHKYYLTKKYPNGETRIETRDANVIRRQLVKNKLNGGLPEILLLDPNHRGKGWMLLEHKWTGSELYSPYVNEVLPTLYTIWGRNIILTTKNRDEDELIYFCQGMTPESVEALTRDEYEEKAF